MNDLMRMAMLNREGMGACREGRLDDALFQLTQALQTARAMKMPLLEAKVLNNLGLVHRLRDETAEAEARLREALALLSRELGEEAGFTKAIKRNLAQFESRGESEAA